jgi:phosphatidylinositol-3-phosphatase
MIETRKRGGRWARRMLLAGVAAATCFGAVAADAGASQSQMGSDAGGPDHIFYIMMENHAYSQIIGNTQDAPFINRLASQNHLASNFHGVTHPSLPNYLAAISGDFQGIFDDCQAGANITCAPEEFVPNSGDGTSSISLTPAQYNTASTTAHLFPGKNLVDQLEAKGVSWKSYMENLPSPGAQDVYAPVIDGTTVRLYAQKHNPFMYFSDINYPGSPRLRKIVPYEANFAKDLQQGTVPNFSFIAANQCHDMHGVSPSDATLIGLPSCGYPSSGLDHGAIQLGDQWLKQTITAIKRSPAWHDSNSEIIIAWDENDYSVDTSGGPFSPIGANGAVLGGGPAPLIVVSNQDSGGLVNNTLLDHYTTLYAIERMWHLGCLANTCNVTNGSKFMNLFTDSSS